MAGMHRLEAMLAAAAPGRQSDLIYEAYCAVFRADLHTKKPN